MFSAGKTILPSGAGLYAPMYGGVPDVGLEAIGFNDGVILGDGMMPEGGFMYDDGFSLVPPSDIDLWMNDGKFVIPRLAVPRVCCALSLSKGRGDRGIPSYQLDSAVPSTSLRAGEPRNDNLNPSGLDEAVPPPSEEDLNGARRTPAEYLALAEGEHARIATRLGVVAGKLDSAVRTGYETKLAEISRRLNFWRAELPKLETCERLERERYAEDIALGERILIDRILGLGAEIFSEPLPDDVLSHVGLRTGIGLRASLPLPPAIPGLEEESLQGKKVSALANYDVGFGRALSLRQHQIMVLNKVRGLLKMRADQLGQEAGRVLDENLLRGTVVMPTGGGKTRVMVAAFAAAIEQGAFKLGDKFIILDHTDKIHGQNLEVAKLLRGYFRRSLGRDLKVSEYKADERDISGDVVVVSIPSINTQDRRDKFEVELKAALGSSGRISMAAIDEIHHLGLSQGKGKESWKEAIGLIRRISPNFYQIGFTATPTGKERPYISYLRDMDLMKSGVTPRTYLVNVEGEDLSQLRVSVNAQDFGTRELVSTLLGMPGRNKRLFEAIERRGLKSKDTSPSGRERLEGTLVFAADLEHAKMIVNGWKGYFEEGSGGLRGRRLQVVGETRGRIGERDLAAIQKEYEAGSIDGIVAIVSGETNEEMRERVLELVEKGVIEAVVNVDVWFEGADLHMFTHLVGARPTFSRFKKGQERGRVNRRGPGEVDRSGRILNDRPRLIFDIVDRYNSIERHLMRYSELMGAPMVRNGELLDVLDGAVAGEVDREGKDIKHRELEELLREKVNVKRPEGETRENPLVAKLWKILGDRYGGDADLMALDLGIPVHEMAEILKGKGWINQRWFLKRLATLLYQERESFVEIYNREREMWDDEVASLDIEILRGALAVYEQWEGPVTAVRKVEGNLGFGVSEGEIVPDAANRLASRTIGERAWRGLWQGLAIYFGAGAKGEGPRAAAAGDWYHRLTEHMFAREVWGREATPAKEKLLFAARQGVALKFGGRLLWKSGIEGLPAQGDDSSIMLWLKGNWMRFRRGSSAQEFYGQVKALLAGVGVEAGKTDDLIKDAVFEVEGWPAEATTAWDMLLLAARNGVALNFGGRLPTEHGIAGVPDQYHDMLLKRWLKNGKRIRFGVGQSSQNFYGQVRALLIRLGVDSKGADKLIRAAVFEVENWPMEAATAGDKLLLAARQGVAVKFGGRLPTEHGIEGVPSQQIGSSLKRWLKGKRIKLGVGASPREFYRQVKALLIGVGVSAKKADELIEAAVFEAEGWPKTATTAKNKLLLAARRCVTVKFGGRLPTYHGIEGVPLQMGESPLKNWIMSGTAKFAHAYRPWKFYEQVRSLLVGLGVAELEADRLVREAKDEG